MAEACKLETADADTVTGSGPSNRTLRSRAAKENRKAASSNKSSDDDDKDEDDDEDDN